MLPEAVGSCVEFEQVHVFTGSDNVVSADDFKPCQFCHLTLRCAVFLLKDAGTRMPVLSKALDLVATFQFALLCGTLHHSSHSSLESPKAARSFCGPKQRLPGISGTPSPNMASR